MRKLRGAGAVHRYATDELEPGRSYYWRIDEVGADGKTIHKGDLWSFTTTPLGQVRP